MTDEQIKAELQNIGITFFTCPCEIHVAKVEKILALIRTCVSEAAQINDGPGAYIVGPTGEKRSIYFRCTACERNAVFVPDSVCEGCGCDAFIVIGPSVRAGEEGEKVGDAAQNNPGERVSSPRPAR